MPVRSFHITRSIITLPAPIYLKNLESKVSHPQDVEKWALYVAMYQGWLLDIVNLSI